MRAPLTAAQPAPLYDNARTEYTASNSKPDLVPLGVASHAPQTHVQPTRPLYSQTTPYGGRSGHLILQEQVRLYPTQQLWECRACPYMKNNLELLHAILPPRHRRILMPYRFRPVIRSSTFESDLSFQRDLNTAPGYIRPLFSL